jgi:hypothetical protein
MPVSREKNVSEKNVRCWHIKSQGRYFSRNDGRPRNDFGRPSKHQPMSRTRAPSACADVGCIGFRGSDLGRQNRDRNRCEPMVGLYRSHFPPGRVGFWVDRQARFRAVVVGAELRLPAFCPAFLPVLVLGSVQRLALRLRINVEDVLLAP